MVLFESLVTVSYSHFTVTIATSLAVCEISSVKEWHDLENWARSHSRLWKMAPFDRSYTTFCWLPTACIALFCTVFELYDVE